MKLICGRSTFISGFCVFSLQRNAFGDSPHTTPRWPRTATDRYWETLNGDALRLQSVTDAAAIPDLPDFDTLLHRVTSVAAQALTYQEQPWFTEAVQTLTRIFERPTPPPH
ncbi:hypothetical protein [Micromonospora rubida]|uniref:hypothetical protein n=1 Tax=Micromonospora rubida TaxID=2697657 RepID=UPI001377B485|nr:hypothetical protein [Micromonospora rubida]NBE81541.1 hypothetical protein [Micromonospora rubida]